MDYSAIVLCAGKGSRSGLSYNKMLYRFNDKTVYEMTMSVFLQDQRCKQIVVVTKEDEINEIKELVNDKSRYLLDLYLANISTLAIDFDSMIYSSITSPFILYNPHFSSLSTGIIES